MLDKILAPLDGSVLAGTVLPHIIGLTRINGTTVTLLHVLETNQSSATTVQPAQSDPVEWNLRKAEAKTYLDEVAEQLDQFDLESDTVVLEGKAAERIVTLAQKEDFDLVALSRHGQGGLSGWNLSNVTSKVVYRLRKSVFIIPAYEYGQRSMQQTAQASTLQPYFYKKILIPLDGSARAECVLPLAEALARRHDSEIVLVHVVTPPDLISRVPLSGEDQQLVQRLMERNRAEATRYLEQLEGRLSAPKITTKLLEADTIERTLLDFAEEAAVDLVLLAAHGHSGHNGSAYGRLASSFINYGSTPLYVHQDLAVDEIRPLYAEQALQGKQQAVEFRTTAFHMAVN